MNSFVNSLLEIILSWVRSIISDIWTILGGETGSFFAWIGRHWLSLVCVLIIGGITVDLLFYILRWHPQRVWLYKLDRLMRRSKYKEEEAVFAEGYDTGIESFHLDEDPLISQYLNTPDNQRLVQYDASVQPKVGSNADMNADDVVPTTYVRQRRRSDRHAKRSARWARKFSLSEESANSQYAYPSPPVHERDAFHDAVYPSANHDTWGRSQNAKRE